MPDANINPKGMGKLLMDKRFEVLLETKLNAGLAKKEILQAEIQARLKILKPVITEIIDFLEFVSNRQDLRFSGYAYPSKSELSPLLTEPKLKFIRENTINNILKNRKCDMSINGLSFSDISIRICFKTVEHEPVILIGNDLFQKGAKEFRDTSGAIDFLTGVFVKYSRKKKS